MRESIIWGLWAGQAPSSAEWLGSTGDPAGKMVSGSPQTKTEGRDVLRGRFIVCRENQSLTEKEHTMCVAHWPPTWKATAKT